MSLLDSLRKPSVPNVAVELAAHHVAAAGLEYRGDSAVITAHAIEPLPARALVPSLTEPNIQDRASVLRALRVVLDRIGSPRRVGLVVPDAAAKVSLLRFEQVPARTADLEQLVRWQIKKTAPFAIEDAQISFTPGIKMPFGQEFVVALAKRTIVEEYEALCADAGALAGIVDLATFNVVNAVLASASPEIASETDWLLVNSVSAYTSIAILRGPHLISFRNRVADEDGTVAELVHQAVMYYEDRLWGNGLGRVFLAGAPGGGAGHAADVEQVRRTLQERLATPIEPVDPRAAVMLTDRISAAPALLGSLAPVVGLLLRERSAA